MNLFYLSNDVEEAARWHVDKHICKMPTEVAQMLSTAHRVLDGTEVKIKTEKGRNMKYWVLNDDREDILYKPSHVNHPSSVWIRSSVENYNWAVDYLYALGNEYTYRYGRKHGAVQKIGLTAASPPFKLKAWDWTTPPSCMPDEYKISDDPIENYREYYRKGKAHLLRYTEREQPSWL